MELSAFSRSFWDSVMYFDTASFALSRVVCAISRIFSACSLICSLMALSIFGVCELRRLRSRWRDDRSRVRFDNLFQLLAKLVDQHPGILGVINRHHDEVHATALERVFERRDQRRRAFDAGT